MHLRRAPLSPGVTIHKKRNPQDPSDDPCEFRFFTISSRGIARGSCAPGMGNVTFRGSIP